MAFLLLHQQNSKTTTIMALIFGKNFQTTVIECETVERETEKAVCFRAVEENGQGVGHSRELSVWIPKSVLAKAKKDESGTRIPFWFNPTFYYI